MNGPSGTSVALKVHSATCGLWLKPLTPVHVSPWSSERNRPWGTVPQYHTPGSLAWPGCSQKLLFTARPRVVPSAQGSSPSFTTGSNFGGPLVSVQVAPPSTERMIVGPRCVALPPAVISSVRPSRGSTRKSCTGLPSLKGPSTL
jgi:hypothetical protein